MRNLRPGHALRSFALTCAPITRLRAGNLLFRSAKGAPPRR
jgi:hypothetical protein